VSSASAAATTGCIACSVEHTFFDDQHDQRAHFGSDWHRKNVKRSQLGKTPLAEQEFEAMLDRQDDDVSDAAQGPLYYRDVCACLLGKRWQGGVTFNLLKGSVQAPLITVQRFSPLFVCLLVDKTFSVSGHLKESSVHA
jgi:hypothetical protein